MGERASKDQQNRKKSPRLGLRNTGGEIVEVQGGHIVRSLARKDRHSKISTAKGMRDRRVRLSAHTAIQFYDVQDRLGFDRPSKAVDWLIKEAKSSIDELAELPVWKPTVDCMENLGLEGRRKQPVRPQQQQFGRPLSGLSSNSWGTNALLNNDNLVEKNSSFLPLSLDSDTIQSFFPMGTSNSSVMQFQDFPQPPDLPPKTSSHGQGLRLSLQSFPDPIFRGLQHSLAYNAPSSNWSELNAGCDAFNPQLLFGQNQFVSQGGSLQSSINTQSIRAWISPSSSLAAADHLQHHHNSHHLQSLPVLSGFCIPVGIQGEEEEQEGFSDKLSVSRH